MLFGMSSWITVVHPLCCTGRPAGRLRVGSREVYWYNHEHRHSGIRYITPTQRHTGQDRALLARRHTLYQQARQRNPRRWSGQTRNWTPVAAVTLNPERDAVIEA